MGIFCVFRILIQLISLWPWGLTKAIISVNPWVPFGNGSHHGLDFARWPHSQGEVLLLRGKIWLSGDTRGSSWMWLLAWFHLQPVPSCCWHCLWDGGMPSASALSFLSSCSQFLQLSAFLSSSRQASFQVSQLLLPPIYFRDDLIRHKSSVGNPHRSVLETI